MAPTLNVIGAGALGASLARLLSTHHLCTLQDVCNRTLASTEAAVHRIGAGRAVADVGAMRHAEITLIATPDASIEALAAALAATDAFDAGSVACHCSGAFSSALLAPLSARGVYCASWHPVASFPAGMLAGSLAGVACALEGDAIATTQLRALATALGMRVIDIDGGNKLVYHAGAVFASNYLVTVIEAALQAYVLAGVERGVALELIAPLVKGTVENVLAHSPASALTGPIRRGDAALVRAQFAALLAKDPALAGLYRTLSEPTARLAALPDPLA